MERTSSEQHSAETAGRRRAKLSVGILTLPVAKTGVIPLRNLAKIVEAVAACVYIVTGGDGFYSLEHDSGFRVIRVDHRTSMRTPVRFLLYVIQQVRLCTAVVQIGRKVDAWIFFIGGEATPMPILFARLLGIDTILLVAGSPMDVSQINRDRLSGVTGLLSNIAFTFSRRVVIYSDRIVQERGLARYQNKILIAREHVVDLEKFRPTKPLAMRRKRVGYIGGVSRVKGVTNLAKAIPKVLHVEQDVRFVICGDGDGLGELKRLVADNRLLGKVTFTGWIPHNDVAKVLNELVLLVLPSYSEGLPNIVLEALACGTPVLSTPVGAIPDVVIHGETGFLMHDNSPECIASNIVAILQGSELESIGERARKFVEENFEFSSVVERFSAALWGQQ